MARRTLIKLTDGLATPVQSVRASSTLAQPTFPRWKGEAPTRRGRASGKANPPAKACRFEESKRTGCAVELDFLSTKDAMRLGTVAGPVLRFCESPRGKATHLSVTSPQDAAAKAKQYCDCVGTSKSKRASCAVKVARNG